MVRVVSGEEGEGVEDEVRGVVGNAQRFIWPVILISEIREFVIKVTFLRFSRAGYEALSQTFL